MAIDGGGGGGGPLGSTNSFTGAASAIEILGNHCYAYSGVGSAGSSEFTGLNFTTGNYYAVCRIYTLYDASDLAAGNEFGYRFEMNGATIVFTRREASADDVVDAPLPPYVDIIIPAYTQFSATAFNNGSGVDMSFQLTGRIYR
jgi:hypothetical protein